MRNGGLRKGWATRVEGSWGGEESCSRPLCQRAQTPHGRTLLAYSVSSGANCKEKEAPCGRCPSALWLSRRSGKASLRLTRQPTVVWAGRRRNHQRGPNWGKGNGKGTGRLLYFVMQFCSARVLSLLQVVVCRISCCFFRLHHTRYVIKFYKIEKKTVKYSLNTRQNIQEVGKRCCACGGEETRRGKNSGDESSIGTAASI